jgi:hypothetical protein
VCNESHTRYLKRAVSADNPAARSVTTYYSVSGRVATDDAALLGITTHDAEARAVTTYYSVSDRVATDDAALLGITTHDAEARTVTTYYSVSGRVATDDAAQNIFRGIHYPAGILDAHKLYAIANLRAAVALSSHRARIINPERANPSQPARGIDPRYRALNVRCTGTWYERFTRSRQ